MIRVVLPTNLWKLADTSREIEMEVEDPPTLSAVLDVLEARYPMLRGTIRDQVTKERRAFIRFFACGEDWSHESPDAPLPEAVAKGIEPLRVVGALAGG
jgi:sulfur-carrier protein